MFFAPEAKNREGTFSKETEKQFVLFTHSSWISQKLGLPAVQYCFYTSMAFLELCCLNMMHGFQWKFCVWDVPECVLWCHVVWVLWPPKHDTYLPFYSAPKSVSALCQHEFFSVACMWNFWWCLVKFLCTYFCSGAHWKACPGMGIDFFKRFKRSGHLHTSLQLHCSEGKGVAGCMHLEIHSTNHNIAILD